MFAAESQDLGDFSPAKEKMYEQNLTQEKMARIIILIILVKGNHYMKICYHVKINHFNRISQQMAA